MKTSTYAQNFIKNYNFDNYKTFLDNNKNLVYQPEYWYYNNSNPNHPIYFSTDRFLNKSLNDNFHPDSLLIKQGQKVNYISILILPNTQKVYSELIEPLHKGKTYRLQVDIKTYDQSNCISDLLVGFKDCIKCDMDSCLYKLKLSIPNSVDYNYLLHNWLTLSTDFVAKGNEKVLLISAGSPENYIKIINSNLSKFCYSDSHWSSTFSLLYFIDNVILTEIEDKKDTLDIKRFNSLEKGESIILHNIYFDFDKYKLLKESFPELGIVYEYMNKNSNVQILVSGYTDNVGTNEYNDELSNNRAKSVIDYLIKKGIAKDRFQSKGFGSRFPIDSNDNEEGRKKNRRIELKVINK